MREEVDGWVIGEERGALRPKEKKEKTLEAVGELENGAWVGTTGGVYRGGMQRRSLWKKEKGGRPKEDRSRTWET